MPGQMALLRWRIDVVVGEGEVQRYVGRLDRSGTATVRLESLPTDHSHRRRAGRGRPVRAACRPDCHDHCPQGPDRVSGSVGQTVPVAVRRLPHAVEGRLPDYKTELSAGVDLTAAIDKPVDIAPDRDTEYESGALGKRGLCTHDVHGCGQLRLNSCCCP